MRRALWLLPLAVVCACRPRDVARVGSKVTIDYTLTVDGVVYGEGVLKLALRSRENVPGLEESILGMSRGEQKEVVVPPEKGYGPADPQAIENVPLSKFARLGTKIRVGSSVAGFRGGKGVTGRVIAMDAESAVVDFNHPLAGKTLVYKIRLLKIHNLSYVSMRPRQKS